MKRRGLYGSSCQVWTSPFFTASRSRRTRSEPPPSSVFDAAARTFLTRDPGLPSDSLWHRHPLRERPQPCRRALRLPTSPNYEESHLPRLSEAVAFLWRPL